MSFLGGRSGRGPPASSSESSRGCGSFWDGPREARHGGSPPSCARTRRTRRTSKLTHCNSFADSFLGDIRLGTEDAPSRFLGPTSPWSFPLSPSFFGRKSPSMSGETNPFDLSFETDSPSKKASLDDWDVRTPGASDLTSAGEYRRKRAMSSPAVTPGGMGFNLTFGGMNSFKRPRLSLDASGSATSGSSGLRHSAENEGSPVSSSVLTPPDSGVLFFPYDKDAVSVYNDPTFFQHHEESLYQSVLAASTQSDYSATVPMSDLPPTMVPTPENIPVTTPSGHSTYAQFVFAPSASAHDPSAAINGSGVHRSVDSVSPFILHLEQERNNLVASGAAYQQPNPGPLSLPPRRVNAPGQAPAFMPRGGFAKRTKGKPAPVAGKGKKAVGKKGKKVVVEEPEEELDEADEEARRKLFLERNRIAACKSRQKKKERVGNLESRQ